MVSVVILSLVTDQNSFEVTKNCVDSFAKSDLVSEIIVVESNKRFFLDQLQANSQYHEKAQVKIPPYEFNYNQFLNIGKSFCTSEYIIFSNNDLIVEDNCVELLYDTLKNDPELMGVCPIDRAWHRHSQMYFPADNKLYTGYYTGLHMFGCIYMLKKQVFNVIGDFDERFFFFYQDDDLAATMCSKKVKHGLLTSARVKHKIAKYGQPDGGEKYRYTPNNMNTQGDIFGEKWGTDPRADL